MILYYSLVNLGTSSVAGWEVLVLSSRGAILHHVFTIYKGLLTDLYRPKQPQVLLFDFSAPHVLLRHHWEPR